MVMARSYWSYRHVAFRYMPAFVFTFLLIAVHAHCSVALQSHVVSQTSTTSKGDSLMEPSGGTAPISMKRRTSAPKFWLLSVITGSVAAVVAFLVLRCFSKFRVEKKSDSSERFLSDNMNKDLVGACGGAFEEGPPSAPSAEGEGNQNLSLSESVRAVLDSAKNAVSSFQKMTGLPYSHQWMALFLRLMTFVGLELGVMSMLLDGPLEERRIAVVEDVMNLAIDVLRSTPLFACRSKVRYRVRGMIRLLEKSTKIKEKHVPLSHAQRRKKLRDLLKIQRLALKNAEELAGKLEDLMKQGVEQTSREVNVLTNQLGILCHQRKMWILRDAQFLHWIEKLDPLTGVEVLGLPALSRYLQTQGPPPPVVDQIQELQAALLEAVHLTQGSTFDVGTPPQSRMDEAADDSTLQRQPEAAPPTDLLPAGGSLLQAQPQGAPHPRAKDHLALQQHTTDAATFRTPSADVSSTQPQPAGYSSLQTQVTAHPLTGMPSTLHQPLKHASAVLHASSKSSLSHPFASSAPSGVHPLGGHSEWPPGSEFVLRHHAPADSVSSSHPQVPHPFPFPQPLSAQAQAHATFQIPAGPGTQARPSAYFLGFPMNFNLSPDPLPHSGKFYGVALGEPLPTKLPHKNVFYGVPQGMPQPPDTED